MDQTHPHPGRPIGSVGPKKRLRLARHADEHLMKAGTPEARAKAGETKRHKHEKNAAEQAARDYCQSHGLPAPRAAPSIGANLARAKHHAHPIPPAAPENLSWAHRAPICRIRVEQTMRDPQFKKNFPLHQRLMAHLPDFRAWLSNNRVTSSEGYLTMEKIKEKIHELYGGPLMSRKNFVSSFADLGSAMDHWWTVTTSISESVIMCRHTFASSYRSSPFS